MKTKITLCIAALLASISLAQAAVEYKTIRHGDDSLVVDPTDLVEITAHGMYGSFRAVFSQTIDDFISVSLERNDSTAFANFLKKGYIITGATSIYVYMDAPILQPINSWVTVKITSKDDPAVPTQAGNVAVIPEDENGQYQVILESSTDLITWTVTNAGTYGGTTTKRFFRTRIVKKATP